MRLPATVLPFLTAFVVVAVTSTAPTPREGDTFLPTASAQSSAKKKAVAKKAPSIARNKSVRAAFKHLSAARKQTARARPVPAPVRAAVIRDINAAATKLRTVAKK